MKFSAPTVLRKRNQRFHGAFTRGRVRRITRARQILDVGRIPATQEHDMATTAWRFSGTEGADEAILKLKQLEAAKLVEVQDVTVIRWPQYAAEPTARARDRGGQQGFLTCSQVHAFWHR